MRFSYLSKEGKPTFSLNGVDLHVPDGRYAALIGPNGSGKTTIAWIIKGLITPDSGIVEVAGKSIEHDDLSPDVGLVFSNPENQIVSAMVEEDIAFGLENMGVEPSDMRRRVDDVMERLNLTHLRRMLPHNLSGGEQQRLVIAGVLVMGLKILVLDEATSMLDNRGRRDILSLIRELNERESITVLSITHSIVEAIQADIIFVLDGGKIVFSGTPLELLFSDDMRKKLEITLPQFPILIKGLVDNGVGLPQEKLGLEPIIEALNIYKRTLSLSP